LAVKRLVGDEGEPLIDVEADLVEPEGSDEHEK
jgi:hypothetical protein